MNDNLKNGDEVRFQLRGDLQFVDYPIGVESQLVVKDPLQLEYFLFGSFERTLLDLLKSPLSANELKCSAEVRLSPWVIEPSEIRLFLQRLLRDNLIVADRAGVGPSLWHAGQRKKRNAWLQSIFGVLAIRFRGVDPQPLLDLLNPTTRYLFHPLFLTIAALLFAVSVVTACLNANRIFETDYLWHNLSNPRTLIPIAVALMVVKILHELGHALACKSIDRDCHELGFMLLAFVPCLYCNVSDVWMEPGRWKRMLVSAGGIYVEMLIAAVCLPLWLWSSSGTMQVFWFAMLTICSVNTLLINGNPLLRYDGYYLLSDWVGIPNLYSQAQESVNGKVKHLLFVNAPEPQPVSWLDGYGVASRIYRIFVIGVIVYAIYVFFGRLELSNLGILVATFLVLLTFGMSLFGNIQKMYRERWLARLRISRGILLLATLLLLAGCLSMIPVSPKVYAEGEVTIKRDGVVYAPEAGQVLWTMAVGTGVKQNQPIARIISDSLAQKIIVQQQHVDEIELAIKNQELLQSQGADNSREIELRKNALSNARNLLGQLEQQVSRLTVFSPADGILNPLPESNSTNVEILDLRRNSSTLFAENTGAFVNSGEPMAIVTDQISYEVRLNVPEERLNRVAAGQSVKMIICQHSPEVITGIVNQVAIDKSDLKFNSLDSEPNSAKDEVVVTVDFLAPAANLFYRSRVKAAIIGDKVPLYQYGWQLINENFEFQ